MKEDKELIELDKKIQRKKEKKKMEIKEKFLEAVKNVGYALGIEDKEFRAEKDRVLEAVKENGNALEYASDELKAEFKEKGIYEIEKEIKATKTNKNITKTKSSSFDDRIAMYEKEQQKEIKNKVNKKIEKDKGISPKL